MANISTADMAPTLAQHAITLNGLNPHTEYNVVIVTPDAHWQTIGVSANAGGSATVSYVPQISGKHTVYLQAADVTPSAIATFRAAGT